MFSSCMCLVYILYVITTVAHSDASGRVSYKKSENPFDNTHYWLDKINNDPLSSWQAGENFDFGLPTNYIRKLLGSLPPKEMTGLPYKSLSEKELNAIRRDMPESFDASRHWSYCKSLQEIRDQGDCGSCWAVAAASVFTDRLCIKTVGEFNGHLSSEFLLACCKKCGPGCEGGYVDDVWIFLKEVGTVTGGDYNSFNGCMPYSKHPCIHYGAGHYPKCSTMEPMITPVCKEECTNPNYQIPFFKDRRKVAVAYKVEPNVTKIQAEILHHGPIQVVFDVYEDFLSYKSGIYKRTLVPENKFIGLHAVKVIGWGIDKDFELPYWLVQNSWNYDWGERGLFKILRGINECNFEIDVYGGNPQ